MDAVEGILSYIKKQHDAQDIKCPRCTKVLTLDDRNHLVTYWGEDGWQRITCEHCDHEFEVEENVMRTYEVREIGQEEG